MSPRSTALMAERPRRSLFGAVTAFELRLQLASPVFGIVVAIGALMVFGSVATERIRVGPFRHAIRDGAAAVIDIHAVWSLFFLFTAAAFLVEAALRDARTGFAPIVAATPLGGSDRALGRFAGSFAALALSFVSVPAGLLLGRLVPWLPEGATGPLLPEAFVFGFLVVGLPNLFTAAALFLLLATTTRSPLAAYLGAVALLALYGLGGSAPAGPWLALLDPFGFAALAAARAGWTEAELATRVPALTGPLGWNRLAWLAVAAASLALAARRENARHLSATSSARRAERRSASSAAGPDTPAAARLALECRLVLRSPFFIALLGVGAASIAANLWPMAGALSARDIADRTDDAFRLVPIVVATFYAGEIVRSERDHRVQELVGATPVRDASLLVPKALALGMLLTGTVAVAGATAMAVALLRGGPNSGEILTLFILPKSFDAAVVAALALFFQAVAPGKVAGFGFMVLYLIASLAFEALGWHGDLYRYGGHAGTLAASVADSTRALLVRGYWGAIAGALLLLAMLLLGRGHDERLGPRLRRLPGRLRARAGLALLLLVTAASALGFAVGSMQERPDALAPAARAAADGRT